MVLARTYWSHGAEILGAGGPKRVCRRGTLCLCDVGFEPQASRDYVVSSVVKSRRYSSRERATKRRKRARGHRGRIVAVNRLGPTGQFTPSPRLADSSTYP